MPALASQVVAVTGGGSGLGRSLVERFLDEGANVGVLELSSAKAAALREDFPLDRIHVVEGDVTTVAGNEALVDQVLQRFGKLDSFIANAGLWDFMTTLDDLPTDVIPDAFREIYSVNVLGPLLGAKASVRALRQTRGTFLLTLSNAALFPGGGGSLYVSSKHAGVGLVRQLAHELAPDIRVNAVAPGGMPSDLRGPAPLNQHNRSFGDLPIADIMEETSTLRRAPDARDYTGAYVMLASRTDGLTATGTVLDVCGGVGVR